MRDPEDLAAPEDLSTPDDPGDPDDPDFPGMSAAHVREIRDRVEGAGVPFMDEHDPGWWRADIFQAINLDELNMASGSDCVLGQRCPVETLAAYARAHHSDLGSTVFHARYAAFVDDLRKRGVIPSVIGWARLRGFSSPFSEEYPVLTAAWRHVIETRRAAG